MDKFNAEWLAQYDEEILEPELKICDAHHHLWDYPSYRYRSEEFLEDINTGHNVVSSIYMECMWGYRQEGPAYLSSVGESEFVSAEQQKYQSTDVEIAAYMVGNTNLTLGAKAGESLEAHVEANPRFRGIRHASGWHAAEDVPPTHMGAGEKLLADATFREGFAELEKRNLSFDAWLYHTNIEELAGLADAFPNTQIILDHCGGPLGIGPYEGKQDEVFPIWKKAISELSYRDNVRVKIGGLNMQINGFAWEKKAMPPTSQELADATAPYYLYCIEQFGVDRCMWQSNFPVDKVSCSYPVLWNSFKRICEGFSEGEKAALFYNTAARVYRFE